MSYAPTLNQPPAFQLDDGVYRPGIEGARVVLTGGVEEEAGPRRSNGPPEDFTRLEEVFPGLEQKPAVAISLEPIDGFLGFSAAVDGANLDGALGQYWALRHEIKQIDPQFVDDEILPTGGIDAMSPQERTNLIDGLRMARAAAYYRMRNDVGPLQVETLRFLRSAVDGAYEEAVKAADAGRLEPRLSRQEAIGNAMDDKVRKALKQIFDYYNIPYGSRGDITINNRDRETTASDSTYRIPDARLRNIDIDWTLTVKTIDTPQIQGFFRADSQPDAAIIIRPTQLGRDSLYLIIRPDDIAKQW